jgi:hypothetical protein
LGLHGIHLGIKVLPHQKADMRKVTTNKASRIVNSSDAAVVSSRSSAVIIAINISALAKRIVLTSTG